jgi:hypothetical protein
MLHLLHIAHLSWMDFCALWKTIWRFKTGVHKFSKNLGATSKF